MTVGRSWRTVAKHELMRAFIGKEVGALAVKAAHWDIRRSVWYDLTAGDGVAPDDVTWAKGCSPGILAHHAARSTIPVTVLLFEIKPATYDRLIEQLAWNLPSLGYTPTADSRWVLGSRVELHAINSSGQTASVSPISRGDAVLVLNDPNAITEWAMRATFATEIAARTWCSRSLSTMGCNPSGIKRLDYDDERRGWFDLIQRQQDALPRHRDLLLSAIERDESQWAYLICDPGKWRPVTEQTVTSAFNRVGRTVAMSWYRADPTRFEDTKRRLFLTRDEYRKNGQSSLW